MKKVITPVNAYVPSQSQMSKEKLNQSLKREIKERKEKVQAMKINREKIRKDQELIRYNRKTYEREQRYIYWVDPINQLIKIN